MRTRKTAKTTPTLVRLGQRILSYIDLLVRTVCIILGLVVSGWVKFIDEVTPPATTNQVRMTAPSWNPAPPLSPLPGIAERAGQSLDRY